MHSHLKEDVSKMSKVLLNLIDQKFQKKIKKSRDQIIRDLRSETSGVHVNFMWNSRYEKPRKLYHVAGIVTGAGLDSKDQITLVIEFSNPETGTPEKVIRYINELKWGSINEAS